MKIFERQRNRKVFVAFVLNGNAGDVIVTYYGSPPDSEGFVDMVRGTLATKLLNERAIVDPKIIITFWKELKL